MAAGIGSRYGGIKQLEAVGPNGEIIIDYSIYDAIQAGFDKIIFIIRKDIEQDFREIIGDRISELIETDYVIQDMDHLPDGYEKPSDRTKPWGTAQAILECEGKIDGPFAVINADDYYGTNSFSLVYQYLYAAGKNNLSHHYCMAGYLLRNTLSPYGGVTRGVCSVNSENILTDVIETSGIVSNGLSTTAIDSNGETVPIDMNATVSMNMWGFTPDIFPELRNGFCEFLKSNENNLTKAEYLLPNIVNDLVKQDAATVHVLTTEDKWVGVTYKEDKPLVVDTLHKLVIKQIYPSPLYM
jgi:dTDP-glucose pyrophosphorylase